MSERERFPEPVDPLRRQLLLGGLGSAGLLAVGSLLTGCGGSSAGGGTIRPSQQSSNIGSLGPLQAPDENGIRTPAGFASRVVARAGQMPAAGSIYSWHRFPDGGATYPTEDGGWIYVSNSEVTVGGGVGALRFDSKGKIVDAYRIQSGTRRNCSGGPTPWGTWLTCEETTGGQVYECDPTGQTATGAAANVRPALGAFTHEAVTVDPDRGQLYMTEDEGDGGFYRFTPNRYPDLTGGRLEIAEVVGDDPATRRRVVWHAVPDPTPTPLLGTPTRNQVAASTAFDGGEGVGYYRDIVYFTTKGDNRVWAYDAASESIEIIYDDALFDNPALTGVDNVTISAAGDVLVAEDGGDMQIVAITPSREVVPLVQVVGQSTSEVTGPAFSPDGSRLYFSSQRGGSNASGITYEVAGPFYPAPLDRHRGAV